MHYVYLLHSKTTGQFYVGSTGDLRQRLYQHNSKQTISTKLGVPWDLVYYEAFRTKQLADERERKLKAHGKGLSELKRRIGLV